LNKPAEYTPAKGFSLLIPSGTLNSPDKHHLFFIVSNACADGFHLLFSVCSIRDGISYDPTCVLDVGSHPFVKAPSYVLYAKPEKLRAEGIRKCVAGWTYTPKEECSADLLKRVCDGIASSAFTPRWAKKYYAENT
jgi:hypothetical protein